MAQNTISDELNRLIQAKADIKSALEEKGLTIGDSSTLDEYPALILEMEVGGGSGSDTSTLIDLIERDITSLEIPYGTTKIGQYAFYNKSSLTNVSIPNTVTEIEGYVFDNTNISRIIIPQSVNILGTNSFLNAKKLQHIIVFSAPIVYNSAWPSSSDSSLEIVLAGSLGINAAGNSSFKINSKTTVYVKNSLLDYYLNHARNLSYKSLYFPLASMSYDSQTYTVTALGRDNLELYVDASLCDSSVYTFDSTTLAGNHTVTVKSVDPSLGVLDEVSLEITI